MSDYRTRLQDAIVKAHEAGDTEAAEMLAKEYKQWSPKSSVSAFDSIKQGMKDPIDAGAQLLEQIVPEGVKNTINDANNYLAEKTGLFPKIPQGGVDQLIRDNEKAYQQKRGNEAGTFDGWRLAGNVTSPANLAIASRIPMTGGLLKTMGGGAALSGATVPVLDGDFATEKAKQVALGGAFAPVGNMVGRMISPKASTNQQLKLLKDSGVKPTIGQTLGGRFNAVEEKLGSYPFVGDAIAKARGVANKTFEKAAFERALKPVGAKLPAGMDGYDAVAYTESVLKNKYDKVLNDIGAIIPDKQFKDSLNSLDDMVRTVRMPNDKKMEFDAVLDTIKQSADDNGVMTSQAYKDLESNLSQVTNNLYKSSNIFDNRIAPAVKQVKQELKNMLKRQAGDNADELAKSNTAWANFKRVQNAAGKLGAEDGSFTPAQFQNAVRALDKSKDKSQFAKGQALGQDLSGAGKSMLGGKLPNSGTADRMLLASIPLAMLDPVTGLSLLSGSLAYTQPGQKILNAAVSSRPNFAVPASEFAREYGKYITPAMVGGLLNQN